MEPFRQMLTGGHPNSLGRTIEVVETVFADSGRMTELYEACFSNDEIVRLRAFNAIRRVFKQRPEWFEDYADRLLTKVALINQASAKWTLAQLYLEHQTRLTDSQRHQAMENLIRTLHEEDDWIALNMSMKTLQHWAKNDRSFVTRIESRARQLADDRRTSVANGARKLLNAMDVSPL